MKKLSFIALLVLCTTLMANAQSNAIKINILSPLVKTFNIAAEHALNETSSAQLGFFYTGFSASDLKYRGFGITPEYRFIFQKQQLQKVFM